MWEGIKAVAGYEDHENKIRWEEVNEAIARLKRNKATCEDRVVNKALQYVGIRVKEEVWRICSEVWRGKGCLEEWKTGPVVSLSKK